MTASTEEMMTLPSTPADLRPFKRGWLKGSRRLYLEERLPTFQDKRAKGKNLGREYSDGVFNAFCQAYPWWLAMDVEPNPAVVYDEAALPPSVMEFKSAIIARLTTGIRNYFENSWNKAEPVNKMTKAQIAKNPVASLLAKVSDVKIHRQRGRTPQQMYSSEAFASIRDEFNQEFAETGKSGKTARVDEAANKVRRAFEELPDDEKKYWALRAKQDAAQVAKEKAEGGLLPSRLEPAETQEALDGLANTMQPLLEGLSNLLGGNVSFFYAGPEPRRGGQVNVISLHVGNDKSAIPQTFATAGGERGNRRRKMAEACIGEFAMECFSYAEQEERALPGSVMPAALPMFMRQQNPWNVAGSNFVVNGPSAGSATLSSEPQMSLGVPVASSPTIIANSKSTKKRGRQNRDSPRKKRRTRNTQKGADADEESSASESSDSDDDGDDENTGVRPPCSPRPTRTCTKQAAPTSPRCPLEDLTNKESPLDNTVIDPALLEDDVPPATPLQVVIPTCGPLDSEHPFGDSPASKIPDLPPAVPSGATASAGLPVGKKDGRKTVGKKDIAGITPKLLVHAEAYIRGFQLAEPLWESLIDVYLEMEGNGTWAGKPLPSRSRPPFVHLWLQNARRIDPELPSQVRDVANGFWAWWAGMQPDWRGVSAEDCPLRERHRPIVKDGSSWGALQTRGLNGHFTTLALLGWWGRACGDDVLALGEWMAAVEDVSWVLTGLSAA